MLCSVPGVCGHHAANSAHVNITLRHRTANTWRKDERIAGGVKAKSAGSQEVEECRGKSGGEGRQFRRRGLQLLCHAVVHAFLHRAAQHGMSELGTICNSLACAPASSAECVGQKAAIRGQEMQSDRPKIQPSSCPPSPPLPPYLHMSMVLCCCENCSNMMPPLRILGRG